MTRDGYKPGTSTAQPQTYTMSHDGFGNMTGVSAGKNYTAYLIRQAIEIISRRMSREYSIWILSACTLAGKQRRRLPSSFWRGPVCIIQKGKNVMPIPNFVAGCCRRIMRGKTIWERRIICEQCENRDLRTNSVRRNLPRRRSKERFLHLSSKSYH